jgi:hypothetical protein
VSIVQQDDRPRSAGSAGSAGGAARVTPDLDRFTGCFVELPGRLHARAVHDG